MEDPLNKISFRNLVASLLHFILYPFRFLPNKSTNICPGSQQLHFLPFKYRSCHQVLKQCMRTHQALGISVKNIAYWYLVTSNCFFGENACIVIHEKTKGIRLAYTEDISRNVMPLFSRAGRSYRWDGYVKQRNWSAK